MWDIDVFSPVQGIFFQCTNYISDTVRGGERMGDVEVFGPIQGTFLCRLSKELTLNASQGTEVIDRSFSFTFIFRAVNTVLLSLHRLQPLRISK